MADDAESPSQAPEPFNLFAGIQPEPLQPPTNCPTTKAGAPDPTNQLSAPAVVEDSSPARNPWVYVTIAIIALVIGLILGGQFLN
ncbi:MAG TPA: hypothetical protein VM680_20535 [Verrucomicrobiae bacterium]|nr:hypothetical protein [Verrucomicrobiae bacterium]